MASLRVFVSHSHKDNAWCDGFVAELQNHGLDVWYDRAGLYVGAQWVKTLEQELQGRDTYLIVLTPDSWASQWVQRELDLALAQQKQIIGVFCKPTQVSGFITNYQLLDGAHLDSRQAAQLVAATLNSSRPAASPQQASQQTPQGASGSSRADVSGEWVSEKEAYADKPYQQLFLSQVGTKITGTGEWYIGGPVTIVGSIEGTSVKLTATAIKNNYSFSYLELNLTFLPPGRMRGHAIRYKREGMFNRSSAKGTDSLTFLRKNN